jgi:hypothetical protein
MCAFLGVKHMLELDDTDTEEIARLISEGCTSGILSNGEGKHISWNLNTEIFGDSQS